MKKFWHNHFVVLMLMILISSTAIFAQTETSEIEKKSIASNKNSNKTAEDSEETGINPNVEADDLIHLGDLIDVDVLGSSEYDWRGTVTPEGFLDGIEFTDDSIYTLCRTENQVAQDIAKSYSKFLRDPKVVVRILDRSKRPVLTLFGAVKMPQRFKIKRKVFLNELIVLAGGFTDQVSGEIRILRQFDASCRAKLDREEFLSSYTGKDSEEFIKVSQDNSSKFINIKVSDLLSGKEEANPQILYGDIVTVLTAEPIYVIGGVVNPTKIATREKLTVSRAIATAGGLTKKANPQKITIFRREDGQTKIINVNLNEIEAGKTSDILLKAYDIVDVAESGRDENKYPPVIRYEDLEEKKNSELPVRIID